MLEAFRSSDDFDEQAHQLYNEGRYDEALSLLKDGLAVYPLAVELHVGLAYARLAREEFAWSRRAFETALGLDPDHEDALAGLGETLLKLGDAAGAQRCFGRVLELGFGEDGDLVMQIGRALFREGQLPGARRFFELATQAQPDSPDAASCLGYTNHRLGQDAQALYWLRRALEIDPAYSEARIYLANMLYDRGESEASLHHLERTNPEEHYDELALWRMVELKKSIYRLPDDDPELQPWLQRLAELAGEPDATDMLLAEIEAQQPDGTVRDPAQLELFGVMHSAAPGSIKRLSTEQHHLVATLQGQQYRGSWDEILVQMKAADTEWAHATMADYMTGLARRGHTETGVVIPVTDAEAFIRGSAQAGVLRIIQ